MSKPRLPLALPRAENEQAVIKALIECRFLQPPLTAVYVSSLLDPGDDLVHGPRELYAGTLLSSEIVMHPRTAARWAAWNATTTSKEIPMAADIKQKTFTRRREEWHVPTPSGFWGDGACWTDLMQAINYATNRLKELDRVKRGHEAASDQIKIKPSDEHVIVFIEFDEERG